MKRGYHFNTDTDTEAVAVLCKYVWDSQPTKRLNFTELIKTVIKELVSLAFSLYHTLHSVDDRASLGRVIRFCVQVHSLPRRDRCRSTRFSAIDRCEDRPEAEGGFRRCRVGG